MGFLVWSMDLLVLVGGKRHPGTLEQKKCFHPIRYPGTVDSTADADGATTPRVEAEALTL